MFLACEFCGCEDTVDYNGGKNCVEAEWFECWCCGARYEIDADADFDGEGYRDCSTTGKMLARGELCRCPGQPK